MTIRQGAPAFSAALLVVVAAACSPGGSVATQLRSWQSGASYAQSQQQLKSDLEDIVTGLRTGPLAAVRTACDGFGVDAANAYGQLPTPDHFLTERLNGEYINFENAAEACSSAPSLHAKAITRFLNLVVQGKGELAAAKRRIGEILGAA